MKKLAIFLLFVVTFSLLVGCDSTEQATNDEVVTVTVWRNSGKPEIIEHWESMIEEFNSTHTDIQIASEILPENTYNDQINAAAMSDDLPDVFNLDGPNMANYVWAGYLKPLDEFVSEEMKADFLPSIIDQATYSDGKMYGLGPNDSGLGIWGNKEYLEKAGVRIPTSVEDAWTLEEFNDALEKLQALDEVEYAIDFKINYGQGEWYTYGFSPIVQSFGGDLINRETFMSEGVINGPETVEALTWFQSLFEKGYANPNQANDDDFYGPQKKSALAYVGDWMAPPHIEGLGEDLVLIPMPDFGNGVKTGIGSWVFSMSNNTEHPEEAWVVMDFILSKENIKGLSEQAGNVPSRISVIEDVELYQEGELLYPFKEQLVNGNGVVRPVTAGYPTITAEFSKAVQNIVKGADVQEQLDIAAQEIDRDMTENNFYK